MISEYIELMKSVPLEDRFRKMSVLGIGLQAMIGLSDQVSSGYDIYSDPMPAGVAIALTGAVIMLYAQYRNGREKKDSDDLITRDIYGSIRHPNYAARGLMSIGLVMQTPSPENFGVGALTLLTLYAAAKAEDFTLAKKYGKNFEDYCNKVPAFIPYSNKAANKLKSGLNKAKNAIHRKK